MKRRLLASLMTLVMMLSMLPTAVWARETGSGGSQETEDTAKLKPQSGEEGTSRETATSKELDLDDGSIVISASGYTQYKESGNVSEDSDDGNYTIKQTNNTTATTNTITVTGGDHTITLNGVNIDVSGMSVGVPCAFAIESGEVTLVLADESENTLKSGWIDEDNADTGISYAGLWVQEQAQVVINGNTGKLAAVGGGSGSSELGNTSLAAGIGASRAHASNKNDPWKSNVGTITIEGGVITATGSAAGTYGGAGIGSGVGDATAEITIEGKVTIVAKAGEGNAAIGDMNGEQEFTGLAEGSSITRYDSEGNDTSLPGDKVPVTPIVPDDTSSGGSADASVQESVFPGLVVTDKDGQRISYTSIRGNNVLSLRVGRFTASLHASLSTLRQLRAEGIDTITFQTILCSTTLSVDELLAMGGEDAEVVLTHHIRSSTLTVGGKAV